MALVRTNRPYPVARVATPEELFDGFERLFEDAFPARADVPVAMDLYETDEALVFELGVPGLTAEAIDVAVEGRQLTVRAELPAAPTEEARRYWVRTMPRGAFTRTVRLPSSVDTEAIDARVQAGMLTLRMPKVAEAKVRKVEIQNA
ncbi:MAG TPA: Hsp20/alpha crystallin family protein [Pseudomonadales bacterium]|nr:Hsp20/alpha crystallin family protein [Pseudomonadales bacterium]